MIVVRRNRQRSPQRVQQEMEEVFHALMPAKRAFGTGRDGLWRPPLEVYETEEALIVRAEIADMEQARLDVSIDDSMLSIRGERPDQCRAEKRSYHEARIPYGAFGADVFIPFPVDAERTEAEYHNGFLRIVLPRSAARTIVPRQSGSGPGDGGKEPGI